MHAAFYLTAWQLCKSDNVLLEFGGERRGQLSLLSCVVNRGVVLTKDMGDRGRLRFSGIWGGDKILLNFCMFCAFSKTILILMRTKMK